MGKRGFMIVGIVVFYCVWNHAISRPVSRGIRRLESMC
jgi:hypothetical protein